MNEKAEQGPEFVPELWDPAAHRCGIWNAIDDAVAATRFGAHEPRL
jgi:hypothetical protein